jgi:hypothetical protein
MAADVKPRIVRETTNMERAARAASLRDQRAAATANHVDPEIIDNALADLEMARIFLDAAGRYHDELTEWLCPNGHMPMPPLNDEVNKAQAIMNTADDRIGFAQEHLRNALDQAWASIPEKGAARDERDRAYRFNEAFIPYRDAWNRGVATYLLNFPGLDAQDRPASEVYHAFEATMDSLYTAARDAAVDALLTPAASPADLALKQEIIDQQEMNNASDGDLIRQIMAQLIADGSALAGGAA